MALELIIFYYGYTVSVKQRKKNKNKLSLAERRRQEKRTHWISALKQYVELSFPFLFDS